MKTVSNIDEDLSPKSLYVPKETVIEKELQNLLKKLQTTHDLSAAVAMMDQIAALMSQQNVRISRQFAQMVVIEIERIVKEQAASYNSTLVWVLTIVGGVIQMGGGIYGAYSITSAFNNNTFKVASQIIQVISSKQSTIAATGSLLSQSGNLVEKMNQGPQTIRQNEIKVKEMRKDQNLQLGNTADGKVAEYLRSKKQKEDTHHSTVSQMLGLTSG